MFRRADVREVVGAALGRTADWTAVALPLEGNPEWKEAWTTWRGEYSIPVSSYTALALTPIFARANMRRNVIKYPLSLVHCYETRQNEYYDALCRALHFDDFFYISPEVHASHCQKGAKSNSQI